MLKKKVVENFKYEKNNNNYWDRIKLYQQIINKALLIIKVFYFGYSLFFLFNNVISHSFYAKDVLQVKDINKRFREKQFILRNRWFEKEGTQVMQPINFLNYKNE